MKIYNPRHLLNHLTTPVIRDFVETREFGDAIQVDWALTENELRKALDTAVDALAVAEDEESEDERIRKDDVLTRWYFDLDRAFHMASQAGTLAFLNACKNDEAVIEKFAGLNEHEKAFWMLAHYEDQFRAAELELIFNDKVRGRSWRRFKMNAGGAVKEDRASLEAFASEVAKLYRKIGAGRSADIEVTKRHHEGRIQLTIYVIGPKTAIPQFTDKGFRHTTVNVTLETAILYSPGTGVVESIAKGGKSAHKAILQKFGEIVLGEKIKLEEIEASRYHLDNLRDGLETFTDLDSMGIEKVRLRRVRFVPKTATSTSYLVEASSDINDPDAIALAKQGLKIIHSLVADYDLDTATVIVYRKAPDQGHFSFDCSVWGTSSIKSLHERHQPLARRLLRELQVAPDGDE